MSTPEDNYDEVRRLLGCKRYEQPPPGYFIAFSDQIIARIQAEDAAEYSSWWSWFVERFDAKPVVVCAYGLAVSSLLFLGFRLSQVFEAEMTANPTVSGPWLAATPTSPISLSQEFSQAGWIGSSMESAFSGSRLVFKDEPSPLLSAASGIRLQPVGFTWGGR